MPAAPGLVGVAKLEVTDADTAVAMHSGDVAVLATPRVVALAEEASCNALAGHLGFGQTTVGMRIQLDHLAPSPVGSHVRAEATLEQVEGRRLTFKVSVEDERGLVAAGKVTRIVVEVDRFLEKCR
jgi:fluoroacetyl-CoA thioesterase